MAPIKFEEHIKDKLEKRSLQTSQDAWNKLSNRLEANDKKNRNPLFWFVGIAASMVGIMIVAVQFFNTDTATANRPIVVDTSVETENSSEEHKSNDLIPIEDAVVILKESNSESHLLSSETHKDNTGNHSTNPSAMEINTKPKTAITKSSQKAPINEAVALNDKPKESKVETVTALTLEELKVIEVVSQIERLNTDGIAVTDQEIDDLLKQAEKEILMQNIYNETTKTVDANALLQDVEADLDQSFRTKVFEALKTSYEKVKTAVAERNN